LGCSLGFDDGHGDTLHEVRIDAGADEVGNERFVSHRFDLQLFALLQPYSCAWL